MPSRLVAVSFAAVLPLLAAAGARAGAPPFATVTLDNGLTVLLAPTSAHPVIAASAYVTTGGRTEDEYFQGSLHYIEHLVYKGGTPNFAPTEFRKRIALLGQESGGWTWDDEINFGFEAPKENFAEGLEALREALLDLEYEEEWFEAEKEVVIQELTQGLEDPDDMIWTNWDRLAFQVHPYGRSVIGTEKAIRDLEMKRTERYYRERFTPNHMILSIAGDFETEEMTRLVRSVWGQEEPGPESFELGLAEAVQTGPRSRVDRTAQASDSRVLLGFVVPGGSHPDAPALDLLAALLNDRSHGLPQYLVEQEKWVVSVGADHYAMRDHGVFTVSARVDPAKAEPVTSFVRQFLEDLDVNKLPPAVFEEARRRVLFSEARDRETVADRAHRFGFLVSRRGREGAEQLLERYSALGAADVQAAKEAWLVADRLVTATLHPEGFDLASAEKRSVQPKAPRAAAAPDLEVAGALLPAAGRPPLAWMETAAADGAHLFTFANGLRLLVQPTDASELLAVSGRVLGGQWVEPDGRPGINRFVSELGMRGTRRWDREGFTRLLGSRSIQAGAHAPSNSRANTSRNVDYRDAAAHHYVGLEEQWPAMLACLKETLFFPSFAAKEIEKLREDQLTEIRSLPENNLEYIKQEFYVRAYAGHPYGRPTIGTEQSVAAFGAKELAAFHATNWKPDRTVVSVVGGVEPAAVAEWVAAHWADLPDVVAEPWRVDVEGATAGWSAPVLSESLDLGKDYWTVNWGRPGAPYGGDAWLPSVVLSRIAGNDHFYKYVYGEGVSYRSWIRFWDHLGPGAWIVENDVKRDRFDEILAMFEEDLTRYSTRGFTKKEFADAVQRLVNGHVLDAQNNAMQAWSLAVAEGNGAGFRRHTGTTDSLRAVRYEEVQTLAREVFEPAGVLRLVQR
ncbi:MAG: M16 family metallopeptidase [Candidatus Eiseniibacteriota bacterium]